MSAPTTSPPPGWYPDPTNQGWERWWDGTSWTEHTRAAGAPPSPAAPAPPLPVTSQPDQGFTYPQPSYLPQTVAAPPVVQGDATFGPQHVGFPTRGGALSGSFLRPRRSRGLIRIFSLAGFGAILLVVGLALHHATSIPASMTQETSGTVVDLRTDIGTEGTDYCAPIVRYTVDGRTWSTTRNLETSPCPYTVGERLLVHYDPRNPSHAAFAQDTVLTTVLWVGVVICGVFLLLIAMIKMLRYGSLLATRRMAPVIAQPRTKQAQMFGATEDLNRPQHWNDLFGR